MTSLVIDNSNGRTKWTLAEGARLTAEINACPTRELTPQRLAALFADLRPDRVVLCSVVPAAAEMLEAFFASRCPISKVGVADSLPVDFSSYAGKDTLGADRVADLVGASALFPQDACVVIDAGTATTLDVLLPAESGRPRMVGGVIAPGVGTLAQTLRSQTAQLPPFPLVLPEHVVGQCTQQALQSGCVRGYQGLLRELISALEQECHCRLKPVITGGDAELVAQMLGSAAEVVPLLTLQGAALCAESRC